MPNYTQTAEGCAVSDTEKRNDWQELCHNVYVEEGGEQSYEL